MVNSYIIYVSFPLIQIINKEYNKTIDIIRFYLKHINHHLKFTFSHLSGSLSIVRVQFWCFSLLAVENPSKTQLDLKPKTATSDENFRLVETLVMKDRRLTVQATSLGLFHVIVEQIFSDGLHMSSQCSMGTTRS